MQHTLAKSTLLTTLLAGATLATQAQVPVPPDKQILSSTYTGTA